MRWMREAGSCCWAGAEGGRRRSIAGRRKARIEVRGGMIRSDSTRWVVEADVTKEDFGRNGRRCLAHPRRRERFGDGAPVASQDGALSSEIPVSLSGHFGHVVVVSVLLREGRSLVPKGHGICSL